MILRIEGDKIKVAKMNTLPYIFNFVIDFFSERFIGLLNIIDLVLIKKWVGFSFLFWRHVKAHTTNNHCANLQRGRVDNYVMIYFGSFWVIMGHYGLLWLIPLFSIAEWKFFVKSNEIVNWKLHFCDCWVIVVYYYYCYYFMFSFFKYRGFSVTKSGETLPNRKFY